MRSLGNSFSASRRASMARPGYRYPHCVGMTHTSSWRRDREALVLVAACVESGRRSLELDDGRFFVPETIPVLRASCPRSVRHELRRTIFSDPLGPPVPPPLPPDPLPPVAVVSMTAQSCPECMAVRVPMHRRTVPDGENKGLMMWIMPLPPPAPPTAPQTPVQQRFLGTDSRCRQLR